MSNEQMALQGLRRLDGRESIKFYQIHHTSSLTVFSLLQWLAFWAVGEIRCIPPTSVKAYWNRFTSEHIKLQEPDLSHGQDDVSAHGTSFASQPPNSR